MTSLETSLRTHIKEELLSADPVALPNVSNLIKTKEGYRKVEEMIIQYAIKNNVSISSAIAHIETEL